MGCGNGDTVRKFRQIGFEANGIDQINLNNGMMVGDIDKKLDLSEYDTTTCIDVFEHIPDESLKIILQNMQQTKQQVISVHNGPSEDEITGIDLHINIKSFDEWSAFIGEYLHVEEQIVIHEQQQLFLCKKLL